MLTSSAGTEPTTTKERSANWPNTTTTRRSDGVRTRIPPQAKSNRDVAAEEGHAHTVK